MALANQFAGTDLHPDADMVVLLENTHLVSGSGWQCPRWRVRHGHSGAAEIAHGLGFLGSANHNNTSGFGLQGLPFVYDQFVENNNQVSVLDISGTEDLGLYLTSDALFGTVNLA